MNKLSKGKKRILYGLMGIIIIIGIIFIFNSSYTIPYDQITIKKLKWSGENVLVITPRFTESAYGNNGFYDYYDKSCGMDCLTIPVQNGRPDRWGSYNLYTVKTLAGLGYPILDDITIHKQLLSDPNYLNQYDTIILLHSEYATKELYQAIINHKHVIYLAPNALYAEISYYDTDEGPRISLVKGHGYPVDTISNGFGWKYDNSPEEYDLDCFLWKFRNVSNGEQLNCVQEVYSQHNPNILLKMKELIN